PVNKFGKQRQIIEITLLVVH
ncbi:esterase YbfF, partial [Vibrio harveyi]